jgi:hypothetical protein
MPILLLAVRIACAVQFGLRVRTMDGRTLSELTDYAVRPPPDFAATSVPPSPDFAATSVRPLLENTSPVGFKGESEVRPPVNIFPTENVPNDALSKQRLKKARLAAAALLAEDDEEEEESDEDPDSY